MKISDDKCSNSHLPAGIFLPEAYFCQELRRARDVVSEENIVVLKTELNHDDTTITTYEGNASDTLRLQCSACAGVVPVVSLW